MGTDLENMRLYLLPVYLIVYLMFAFFWRLFLVWTLIAQARMGNSWRIGIDANTKTQLVTQGIFGISRNPIFLGMRVTLLGPFLLLPNAVTLTTFVLGEALMQIQVHLEEEYLRQTHGEAYRKYCRRARRWI